MKHLLPELPYGKNTLAPFMSEETLEYHYGKHLQTYIDNLNRMIEGSPYEEMPLEDIIMKSTGGIFNNAAQTWNHTFFFETLSAERVPVPDILEQKIKEAFGSMETFKDEFTKAAISLFGSGWVWLATDPEGKISIVQESNAGNPMTRGLKPLLTLDVWEHAYYIDYRNRRAAFIESWWNLVNWEKVAERL